MGETVRINRFLASAGLGARRKVESLITRGKVTVNGQRVSDLSLRVDPERDCVRVGGRVVKAEREVVYIVLNKPADYLTTANDPRGRRTIYDLLGRAPGRIFPVGRLDRMSEGLLLLTNDGPLAHRLAHPRYGIRRVYRLGVAAEMTDEQVARFRRGVRIDGRMIRPREVTVIHRGKRTTTLEVVLIEGRNREIRRICESLDLRVNRLRRIQFGPLSIRGVPTGEWRPLRGNEVDRLRKAVRLGV